MANKTSIKSTKVAKSAAKRVDAKAAKPRKTAAEPQPRKVAKPTLLAGGNPQIAKANGDAPCRPTSRPCRAGNRTSGVASTRSSCAPSPACARQSNGTRRFTGSRARTGSSASIASRTTSKSLSSAAHRCVLSPPGESKSKDTRYLDIHEDDQLDEAQLAAWVKQASQLPGERM